MWGRRVYSFHFESFANKKIVLVVTLHTQLLFANVDILHVIAIIKCLSRKTYIFTWTFTCTKSDREIDYGFLCLFEFQEGTIELEHTRKRKTALPLVCNISQDLSSYSL